MHLVFEASAVSKDQIDHTSKRLCSFCNLGATNLLLITWDHSVRAIKSKITRSSRKSV